MRSTPRGMSCPLSGTSGWKPERRGSDTSSNPQLNGLLQLGPGERVLEIACGNGEFARRMSELGGKVVAVDFSEGMLKRARAHGGDVDYRHTDAMA